MTIYADMHLHTTQSDGSCSVRQIVQRAESNGLRAIALTDHDVVHLPNELTAVDTYVDIIPGVELSTTHNTARYHLLGYWVMNTEGSAIRAWTKRMQELRLERNFELLSSLQRETKRDVSMEDIKKFAGGGVIGRPQFAQWLITQQLVETVTEAFELYLGETGCAYVPRQSTQLVDAIDAIRSSHGVAVLAHPGLNGLKGDDGLRCIRSMADVGLQGLEVFYPGQSEAYRQYLLEAAEEFGLSAAGGSDFHGPERPDHEMATTRSSYGITEPVLDELYRCRNT